MTVCERLHVGGFMTSLNDAVSSIYVAFHKATCDRMHLWAPQCLFTNMCVCEWVVFAHRRHRKAISAGRLSGMMSTFSCKWIDLLSAIMLVFVWPCAIPGKMCWCSNVFIDPDISVAMQQIQQCTVQDAVILWTGVSRQSVKAWAQTKMHYPIRCWNWIYCFKYYFPFKACLFTWWPSW